MDVSCRVCYATLVTEKALGKKLRKCTRCNTALYASREAQRSHWKLHKAVCRAPNPNAGAGLTFRGVFQAVDASIARGGDADTAVLLRRLAVLFRKHGHQEEEEEEEEEGNGDSAGDGDGDGEDADELEEAMEQAELRLHALGRGVCFR